MSRLLVIGFIWLGCAAAWSILGASLSLRSTDVKSARGKEVYGLWGAPLHQQPPEAFYTVTKVEEEKKTVEREGEGPVTTTIRRRGTKNVRIPLDASDLTADFDLEHRRRGLMWFATYGVRFAGAYTFENDSGKAREVTMRLPLETASRTYDGLRVVDQQGTDVPFTVSAGTVEWTLPFDAGESRRVELSFRTRGTGSWSYDATPGGDEARNFALRVNADFDDVDFPIDSVSPSSHTAKDGRWTGEWAFSSLITSSPIGLQMPEKLNPGPLAARITFFAPISLLFFFFVVSMLAITSGREFHPMHYFLLGCAFFAFHLLFAYLVDHIPLVVAFCISSLVSLLLVVSYVRHFVGWSFALTRVAPVQLLYLVLFSASFFWQGFTGLAITIGAVLTLFAVMQLTGRLDWAETFARRSAPREAEPGY